MKRYEWVIGLKEEKVDEYKKLHAAVWPEILKMISECNFTNYSILFDFILDIGYIAHRKGNGGGGVNAFYGDGHVEFRNSRQAFDYIFDSTRWTSSLDSFNHYPEMYYEFVRKL